MKKAIIITTINEPTEAVKRFSLLKEYDLIIVGDKKTPAGWSWPNTTFLSAEDPLMGKYQLFDVLPFNHYCRKMLGYLYAIEKGYDSIVDTDDDNIPKDNWSFPTFKGEHDLSSQYKGFVNIYNYYTSQPIWPRGLPLHQIKDQFSFDKIEKQVVEVGIWQGLADEDPDVDAIYRLTSDKPCEFNQNSPLVLDDHSISPFNTQNTIIRKELFCLMYLPTYVTFRFTDILRGLVAQPIMWLYGYKLGFLNATVIQKRNPHDYFKDFVSEIPMFLHGKDVVSIITPVLDPKKNISENLLMAYQALRNHEIVSGQEIVTLKAWIQDIQKLQANSKD